MRRGRRWPTTWPPRSTRPNDTVVTLGRHGPLHRVPGDPRRRASVLPRPGVRVARSGPPRLAPPLRRARRALRRLHRGGPPPPPPRRVALRTNPFWHRDHGCTAVIPVPER